MISIIVLSLLWSGIILIDCSQSEYREVYFGQSQRVNEKLAPLFLLISDFQYSILSQTAESQELLLWELVDSFLYHIVFSV